MSTGSHETRKQLYELMRSRYPVIALLSHEEARILRVLQSIAAAPSSNREIVTWSIVSGFQRVGTRPSEFMDFVEADSILPTPDAPNPTYVDNAACRENPLGALARIRDYDRRRQVAYTQRTHRATSEGLVGAKSMFVLLDAQSFMDSPVFTRSVRETANALRESWMNLFFLQPSIAHMPESLQKEVVQFDYPLPTRSEIATIIENFMSSLDATIPCTLDAADQEQLVAAMAGMTEDQIISALARASVRHRRLSIDALPLIVEMFGEFVREVPSLTYYPPKTTIAEAVGGLDLVAAYIKSRVPRLTDDQLAFGLRPTKAVLIFGIPGVGKSLISELAGGGSRPVVRCDLGTVRGGIVGQTEANLAQVFKIVRAMGATVWFDELEKVISTGGELDGGMGQRTLAALLIFMQEQTECFVICTANDVAGLNGPMLRRFSAVFFADVPDEVAREQIVRIHVHARGQNVDDLDLDRIVQATEDYTGAEIEKAIDAAMYRAWDEQTTLQTAYIIDALTMIKPIIAKMAVMPDKRNPGISELAALRAFAADNAMPAATIRPKQRQETMPWLGTGRSMPLDIDPGDE